MASGRAFARVFVKPRKEITQSQSSHSGCVSLAVFRGQLVWFGNVPATYAFAGALHDPTTLTVA